MILLSGLRKQVYGKRFTSPPFYSAATKPTQRLLSQRFPALFSALSSSEMPRFAGVIGFGPLAAAFPYPAAFVGVAMAPSTVLAEVAFFEVEATDSAEGLLEGDGLLEER